MKLEDSLKGGYSGLYAEVVTHDTYRVRGLDFTPDLVIDIGANVGVFTRFARSLWPDALIVAVEPNPENFAILKEHTDVREMVLFEAAYGKGEIYHGLTARNGSGETYLSAGLGYPEEGLKSQVGISLERVAINTIDLWSLMGFFHFIDERVLLKMDCEGAENSLWEDERSLAEIAKIDYVAMEIHDYALNGALLPKVKEAREKALKQIQKTHNCKHEGVHFWARRK